MDNGRLEKQISFLVEIDKLKSVFRQTYLADSSRKENDAEHSWHFALYALVLAEHAAGEIDVSRVVKMALIHDIVEVDAGDNYVYDRQGDGSIEERERAAAERIFGLLPARQAGEFRALWEEFEAGKTPDARCARALDRLQPLLNNIATGGATWREHGTTYEQVIAVNSQMADGAPALWQYAKALIDDAAEKGFLRKEGK